MNQLSKKDGKRLLREIDTQEPKEMALRDYIAVCAMQGLLASDRPYHEIRQVAEKAYKIADAMLAERERGNG